MNARSRLLFILSEKQDRPGTEFNEPHFLGQAAIEVFFYIQVQHTALGIFVLSYIIPLNTEDVVWKRNSDAGFDNTHRKENLLNDRIIPRVSMADSFLNL